MEKFILILKTSTKIHGLIQIYKKKSDEQNRFTYSATSPFSLRNLQKTTIGKGKLGNIIKVRIILRL